MKKNSFENYIKGERRGKEAYDVERFSLEDPFLSDAIDGFDSVNGDHQVSIEKMRADINRRTASSKKYSLTSSMYWRAIAVCVVLTFLIGGGYLLMLDEKNTNKQYSTASADSKSIELYIPKTYLEKKDNQIMQGKGFSSRPVDNIENIEVLNIEKDLYIYLPKDYSSKKSKGLAVQ